MTDEDSKKLDEMLIRHEGKKLKPYLDTTNPPKFTIGVGRNLTDNGINESECKFLFFYDKLRTHTELERIFDVGDMDSARHGALFDMLYNLGEPRFREFRRMVGAVKRGDWQSAANEMQDSLWAKQVGARADELAIMLRTGKWIGD